MASNSLTDFSETTARAQAVAAAIGQRWDRRPRFGIILGTGAGELGDEIEAEQVLPYGELPYCPTSTAMGHKGQFVCGQLAGANVIAMQGRFHLYEGYPVDQATLPIHVLHQMGVEILFVSNASGGINPKFRSGEIMLIDSHVNGRPALRSDYYDSSLMEIAMTCARREGFPLHRGVYAAMLGPNYETRAEYRFLKTIGADNVGMSTVPEIIAARHMNIPCFAISVITDMGIPELLKVADIKEIIAAAEKTEPKLILILKELIARQ